MCLAHGVIQKGEEVPCPVDANGRYTSEVPDFKGQHVKDADEPICARLKADGRLVHKEVYPHSYPFCWRSDTPLIYKAVPSWFVAVESIKERLLANNGETYWVPAFVKEKRFHNWLADAKDWAISRNRFWGTPIPLWVSDDGKEVVAVGSIAELRKLSGRDDVGDDLHRESVDAITLTSPTTGATLRRVDEVFDCWFESGSMPYAQQHYPFENKETFEASFPADFIAEGLDQTRGWFYTLMVISTALFDRPAFKNLIVNGLVLAADGKKMSKRLKNYPDPQLVIDSYGADALRLYLINSPVVHAEPLKFTEPGVKACLRDVFNPWFNAFRFFAQNAQRWEEDEARALGGGAAPGAGGARFTPDAAAAAGSANVTDVWVQASLQELIRFVHAEMRAYRLYTVVPRLLTFLEGLTNWYVRLNRGRLKGLDGDRADARLALRVLHEVLFTMTVLMAPLTPYFTEYLYQKLRPLQPAFAAGAETADDAPGKAASVHFLLLPDYDESRLDPECEAAFAALRAAVDLGRKAREKREISLKTPVKAVTIVARAGAFGARFEQLRPYIADELNAWELTLTHDEGAWCTFSALPNNLTLGKRLGKEFGALRAAVAKLTSDEVARFAAGEPLSVNGHALSGDDLLVKKAFKGDAAAFEAAASDDGALMVVVDTRRDETVVAQRVARELLNRVQKLRKRAELELKDEVDVFFAAAPLPAGSAAAAEAAAAGEPETDVAAAVAANAAMLEKARVRPLAAARRAAHAVEIARDVSAIGTAEVTVCLCRPAVAFDEAALGAACAAALAGGGASTSASALATAARDVVVGHELSALRADSAATLEVVVGGTRVALRRGVEFFLSAADAPAPST